MADIERILGADSGKVGFEKADRNFVKLNDESKGINGFRIYKNLDELGLTAGTETMLKIAKAMSVNSIAILVCAAANNADAYPNKNRYGTLVVYKTSSGDRVDFTYTTITGERSYCHASASGDTWTDWKDTPPKENLLWAPKNKYFKVGIDFNDVNENVITYTTASDNVINLPVGATGAAGLFICYQSLFGENTLGNRMQEYINTVTNQRWCRTKQTDGQWTTWKNVIPFQTFTTFKEIDPSYSANTDLYTVIRAMPDLSKLETEIGGTVHASYPTNMGTLKVFKYSNGRIDLDFVSSFTGTSTRKWFSSLRSDDTKLKPWNEVGTTFVSISNFPFASGYTNPSSFWSSKLSKSDNFVQVTCACKKTTANFSPDDLIGTLPAGYRPSVNTPVVVEGRLNDVVRTHVSVTVRTDGRITLANTTTGVTINEIYFSCGFYV